MIESADRAALFARIMEEPDDDAPRLIYSDILEEEGDSDRAEFIRLQIQHARMAPDDPTRSTLQSRIEELRSEHGVKWINELPNFRNVHWEIFERGFISTVRFEKPDAFFEHASSVLKAAPISRLRLEQFYSEDFKKIAKHSSLRQIQELDLEGGCRAGNSGIQALIEADSLGVLKSLRAPNNNLGPAAVRMIAHAPFASRLNVLDISRNDIHDDGVALLADQDSPHEGLLNLTQLCISNCQLTTAGVDAVFSTPSISRLRTLMIGGNHLGSEPLFSRLNFPGMFVNLRDLLADRCGLTDTSVADFVRQCNLPALEWLYLRQNNLTDAVARLLIDSNRFPKLRDINLDDNRISRRVLSKLLDRYSS